MSIFKKAIAVLTNWRESPSVKDIAQERARQREEEFKKKEGYQSELSKERKQLSEERRQEVLREREEEISLEGLEENDSSADKSA